MNKYLYLHIKSTSLAHYYVSAAILPTKYIKGKIVDIQDSFPECLLLSSKKWSESCDCSLEIALSQKEFKELITINQDYFLLQDWLTISRVTQILFDSKEQKETTIWNIEQGAGFVPNECIKIEKKSKSEISLKSDFPKESASKHLDKNLNSEIQLFDRILGSISFLQVLNGLKGDRTNSSISFLSILSNFDKKLKEQYLAQDGTVSTKYNVLFNAKIKDNDYKNFLFSSLNNEELVKASERYNVKLEKKFGAIDIERINDNSYFYILAAVADYGNSGSKNELDLVANIYNKKFSEERLEGLCVAYGLHRGYKSLRNSYTVKSKKLDIKFKMNSNFDSNAIESIYSFIKHQENNVKFESQSVKQIQISPKYKSFKLYDTIQIVGKQDSLSQVSPLSSKLITSFSKIFNSKYLQVNEVELRKVIVSNVKETISLIDKKYNEQIDQIEQYYKELSNKENSKQNSLKEVVKKETAKEVAVKEETVKEQVAKEIVLEITNEAKSGNIKISQKNLFDTGNSSKLSEFNSPEEIEKYLKKQKKKQLIELCKKEYVDYNSKMKVAELQGVLLEKYID